MFTDMICISHLFVCHLSAVHVQTPHPRPFHLLTPQNTIIVSDDGIHVHRSSDTCPGVVLASGAENGSGELLRDDVGHGAVVQPVAGRVLDEDTIGDGQAVSQVDPRVGVDRPVLPGACGHHLAGRDGPRSAV